MVGDTGLEPVHPTHSKHKDLCTQEKSGGAISGAFDPDFGPAGPTSAPSDLPPDVAELARRLAALPESIRAEIVAMVKADERNVPPGRGTR
jgi:hypothetical protein